MTCMYVYVFLIIVATEILPVVVVIWYRYTQVQSPFSKMDRIECIQKWNTHSPS